jgi:Nitrile hydratase beta subunit, N-terminal
VAGQDPAALIEAPLDEPWQGRAVALAVELVQSLGLPWDAFRRHLMAAVDDEPHRPYYESWLVALEALAAEHGQVTTSELVTHGMAAASYRIDEVDHGDLEVFPLAVDEPTLLALLTEVFGTWWPQIRFGPLINGAVYELRAPHAPSLSMEDGYLTIGFDGWHVHLCIGEHTATPHLARRRRCTHAELQRLWIDGAPRTWLFRMFNGEGAQQLTVLLPNPFLDDDQHVLAEPDWSRLDLWDLLRDRFLGLPPDPADRSGDGFRHP